MGLGIGRGHAAVPRRSDPLAAEGALLRIDRLTAGEHGDELGDAPGAGLGTFGAGDPVHNGDVEVCLHPVEARDPGEAALSPR